MKSTVTINKDDNLLSLKVSRSNKPCKKHHYFLDIDNAYDKFYEFPKKLHKKETIVRGILWKLKKIYIITI